MPSFRLMAGVVISTCLLAMARAAPAPAAPRPATAPSSATTATTRLVRGAEPSRGTTGAAASAAEKSAALSSAASRLAASIAADRKFLAQCVANLPAAAAPAAREKADALLTEAEDLLRGFRTLTDGLPELAKAAEQQSADLAVAQQALATARSETTKRLEQLLAKGQTPDRLSENRRLVLLEVDNSRQKVASARAEADRALAAQKKTHADAAALSSSLGFLGNVAEQALAMASPRTSGSEPLGDFMARRRKVLDELQNALTQGRDFRAGLELDLALRQLDIAGADLAVKELNAELLGQALEKLRTQVGVTVDEVRRTEASARQTAAEAVVQKAAAVRTAEQAQEEKAAADSAENRLRQRQLELERAREAAPDAAQQTRLDARALQLQEEEHAVEDRRLQAKERAELAALETRLARGKEAWATEQSAVMHQILEVVQEALARQDRAARVETLYRTAKTNQAAAEQDSRAATTSQDALRLSREALAKRKALQTERAAKEKQRSGAAEEARSSLLRAMQDDLKLLADRLAIADSAIAATSELVKLHGDRAKFFGDAIATLSGFRRESDTRLTASSLTEGYQSLLDILSQARHALASWPDDVRLYLAQPANRTAAARGAALLLTLLLLALALRHGLQAGGTRLAAGSGRAVQSTVELALALAGPLLAFAVVVASVELLGSRSSLARALFADPFLFLAGYRLAAHGLFVARRHPLTTLAERVRPLVWSACDWGLWAIRYAAVLLLLEHLLRTAGSTRTLLFLVSAVRNMGLLAIAIGYLAVEHRDLGRMLQVSPEGTQLNWRHLYNSTVERLYAAALIFLMLVGGLWLAGYQERADWLLRSTTATVALTASALVLHRLALSAEKRKWPPAPDGSIPWYQAWLRNTATGLIVLAALLAIAGVWSVQVRFLYGIFTSPVLKDAAARAVTALVIVLASRATVQAMRYVIYRIFAVRTVASGTEPVLSRRGMTLAPLLISVVRYTVYFIAAVLVLKTVGLDPTPLVAGAGVVGLAVGFGAQSLVKDVITGFFIIAEDLINVGDIVELDGKIGQVEEITVRVTKLRLYSGELRIIPNSEIRQIGNRSRGFLRAIVAVKFRRTADVDEAIATLREVVAAFQARHAEHLLAAPEVHGIVEMDATDVTIRAVCKVRPSAVDDVERELRREIKRAFDRKGLVPAVFEVAPPALTRPIVGVVRPGGNEPREG